MPAALFRYVGPVAAAFVLSSCGLFGKDDPPPAEEIEIKNPAPDAEIDFLATVSPLANPGSDGVPSPVAMRLYVLSAPNLFTQANFFELWEHDEATLGSTLLGRKELFLIPSDVQHISAPLSPDALAVGVTVGYENYLDAKWRAIIPLQGERTLKIRAKVESASVTLVPQEPE